MWPSLVIIIIIIIIIIILIIVIIIIISIIIIIIIVIIIIIIIIIINLNNCIWVIGFSVTHLRSQLQIATEEYDFRKYLRIVRPKSRKGNFATASRH